MDWAEEQPQPPAMESHFATVSQAILATQDSDHMKSPIQIRASPDDNEVESKALFQEPPATTTIPFLHNYSQELLTPWSCQGVKIFVDICSGADEPLSTAVRALGFPALAVDILIDSRMDLLKDEFFEQLLRLCGSGIVG